MDVRYLVLKLKNRAMADDTRPIDSACECMVCKSYSRAYLHCLVTKDAICSQLLSYHNLFYMMKLSRKLHASIIEGRFPDSQKETFLNGFAMPWRLRGSTYHHAVLSSCLRMFYANVCKPALLEYRKGPLGDLEIYMDS